MNIKFCLTCITHFCITSNSGFQPISTLNALASSKPSLRHNSWPSIHNQEIFPACNQVLPSLMSSSEPSIIPSKSVLPSYYPSMLWKASYQQSITLSVQPSLMPTSEPSVTPSTSPSAISSYPSSMLSMPSYQQSTTLSVQPSITPSLMPHCQQSITPSSSPIAIPSYSPMMLLKPSRYQTRITQSVQPTITPSLISCCQPFIMPKLDIALIQAQVKVSF